MSESRLKLIKIVFEKMDRYRDGQITVDDLKLVYSVKKNPKYLNGELTEEQCLRKFLDSFDSEDHKDGIVTYDEFINYYAGVSSSIDSDVYFDVIILNNRKLRFYF